MTNENPYQHRSNELAADAKPDEVVVIWDESDVDRYDDWEEAVGQISIDIFDFATFVVRDAQNFLRDSKLDGDTQFALEAMEEVGVALTAVGQSAEKLLGASGTTTTFHYGEKSATVMTLEVFLRSYPASDEDGE